MGLVGGAFGEFENVVDQPLGLLLAVCALGLVIFGTLWWRLHRRLQRLTEDVATLTTGRVSQPHDPEKISEITPILATLVGNFDEAQRKLAAVTAEMEAERDAALKADHSKTHFLAAASHDLRQPLQALGLFVATLAQQPLPDELRHIVGKIEGSLEALEHLLDALLDISRLDAGAIEAHSMPFPLQNLFNRMAFEFAPLAERKDIRLRMVDTTAVVRSDPALLERILRNLLSNAIRYTRRGGVLIGCRRRGNELRIEVWDSGRGIAIADQREIFREFHRLSDDSNDGRQGLGLGLAIVERLTNLLGLQIDLRSVVGRGSMFAIVLPATEPMLARRQIAKKI
ncbi:HAMP domain-containing sensor histidine kinase [Telmatospirillum sp.]|uniref:sensor histidine kinase n=1 Tax=Telmatospirillum sp. TaxID=2079197 RepID=UPI00283D3F5D|nr:HAMP domain-containing sensor histidine kinase [Telmatospirillum sp.]MDR3441212.1 HAMP domain-containing sensor histidine kinase [Telmatospirillum sp.]